MLRPQPDHHVLKGDVLEALEPLVLDITGDAVPELPVRQLFGQATCLV
jgi:23S rRNA maturation mini-RNase III